MKKLLAMLLALIMVMSICLVSCDKDDPADETPDDDPGNTDIIDPSKDPSDGDGDKDPADGDGDGDNTGWTACAKPIYAMADGLNIRSTPSSKATNNKIGQVNLGDELTAVEKNEEWYKITYNGEEAYVGALYVTEEKNESVFKDLDEAEVLKIKEEGDNEDPYKVAARVAPIFDSTISALDMTRENTSDGQLKKVGTNEKGNIWIVEYTKKGETTPTTYYIGKGGFGYFEGYNAGTGGIG